MYSPAPVALVVAQGELAAQAMRHIGGPKLEGPNDNASGTGVQRNSFGERVRECNTEVAGAISTLWGAGYPAASPADASADGIFLREA